MADSWFSQFFQGMTLDVWSLAMTPQTTAEEAAFIANNLNAPEGSHLLDVPCGNGRLSFILAEMGFRITGVDTAQQWIDEARSMTAKEQLQGLQFLNEDMRTLEFLDKFDGAYCVGNSFGFFDEAETRRFLQAVKNSLKPGGRFILDTLMVAESFLTNGGVREWQEIENIYMLVENRYDCRRSVVESVYSYIDKTAKQQMQTSTAFYHIYTSGQICRMFEECGFEVVDLFSSVDEEPYELGSAKLMLVAESRQ